MEKKRTILHADDEKMIRELVSTYLHTSFPDYDLELHENGTSFQGRLEGLVLNPGNVELAITDREMPGINGDWLIEQYARRLQFPIILVYGGEESIGKKAIKDGAFGYLLKPFRFQEFSDLIQKALDSK